MRTTIIGAAIALLAAAVPAPAATTANPPPAHPILFVTQVPTGYDNVNMTISAPFANHLPTTLAAPRGGDLVLLGTDFSVRALTFEAGYGTAGGGGLLTGNAAIAVRDPAINFAATRAIFSMVVGAPATVGGPEPYTWRLYEITNLQAVLGGAVADIQPVPNQPAAPFNNVQPNYLSDGSIVFVSDRPRSDTPGLYPILDEYRAQPANSGLWRLDPASGALSLLENTPSGSFRPFVDSFGRLVFTRWDHLNQDLNNDPMTNPPTGISPFDYAGEETLATTGCSADVYPEPIHAAAGSNLNGFEINQLFPWTVNQDGSDEEILNHVGRHELLPSFKRSYTNDANLLDFSPGGPLRANVRSIGGLSQIREDPQHPGRYVGMDGVEFFMHHSGQIVAINAASGPPATLLNADDVTVDYITDRQTSNPYFTGPSYPYNIGHFRDPLPMSDGTLIAAFAATPGPDNNNNTVALPLPPGTYAFRLYPLVAVAQNSATEYVPAPGPLIAGGISKSGIQYNYASNLSGFASGTVDFSGALWELQPVEVVARTTPPATVQEALEAPEQKVFDDYNAAHPAATVGVEQLRGVLKARDLALVVVRNATSRDRADQQQPYNLAVPGGQTTISDQLAYADAPLYCIDRLQFFEADQVRAFYPTSGGSSANPLPGRRPIARPLNDAAALANNPPGDAGAPGSQFIADDGSVALFVPARRPLVWQSLAPQQACGSSANPAGSVVVRERYWIEFQRGEMRACNSCHGVNESNQAGAGTPGNDAKALAALLAWWRLHGDSIFADALGD
jgi:hypothetical protein